VSVASDSSLALFLLVVVHFVHSLPFTRCFWVRTASLVNYPASFEGLVLIEVCGMDIHIPPPLGFFALWQKVVQANRSITTTSSKQNTSGMLAGLSSCHQLPDADVSIIRVCSCTVNNVNIKVSYHCHCV
jgi:hypothetical protein